MNICNYRIITFNIPKHSSFVKKRRMKHLANSYKKQREFENLEVSADSFYVTLFSTATEVNKGNVTTNFTNTLFTPLNLKGQYEVALNSISFSRVKELDLGEIVIFFIGQEGGYRENVKISARMGEDYNIVFEQINKQLAEAIQIKEYQRRLYLRKLHHVPSNVNVLQTDKQFISLPLKDNKIYDTIVLNEIKEMTPSIVITNGMLKINSNENFEFDFSGNITKIFPGLANLKKFDSNKQQIPVTNQNFPDFNSCIVTCDILENEHCQEQYLPILKCVSLNLNDYNSDRAICKEFDNMTYQKVKKDVNNLVRTIPSINIMIKTHLNQLLSFQQGEVLVRLHFRKINDGL